MKIKYVFFDMGGTIETYRRSAALGLSATPGLRQLLNAAGMQLEGSDAQLYDLVAAGLKRYHAWSVDSMTELPSWQVWRDYILPGYPLDTACLEAAAETLMLHIETRYYERALRPEVPAALAAISGMGLGIGLISNVNSRGQVPLNLEAYGIQHYFNPVVLSSEYGRRKPDPAIFHRAAWLAGVPTSECVYIGDRIARDILGARRAGFRMAVQITHDFDHGETDDGAIPDAVIHSMAELPDLIRPMAGGAAPLTDASPGAAPRRLAVLFDAGDVLYYRPRRREKLREFLLQIGLDLERSDEAARQAAEDQAFCGQISQEQYRVALLRACGVTRPEHLQCGLDILQRYERDLEFFEGAAATLRQLKTQGYLLGIITDTAAPLHEKLGWLALGGMGDVWDSVISSRESGIRKPAPAIYQASLRQLGVEPIQAVFVGHKASELDGARAVGIKTVAFNYEETAVADCYITKLADLLQVLPEKIFEPMGEM